jgi:hypothetical protein
MTYAVLDSGGLTGGKLRCFQLLGPHLSGARRSPAMKANLSRRIQDRLAGSNRHDLGNRNCLAGARRLEIILSKVRSRHSNRKFTRSAMVESVIERRSDVSHASRVVPCNPFTHVGRILECGLHVEIAGE